MTIEVDVADGVGTVTLSRPEVRNALTPEIVEALGARIVELDEREDVAAIILTGADPAFCAGFDLGQLSTGRPPGDQDRRHPAERRGLLPAHETPLIGAVNGPAVTGGLELALACDFLIASERARFADTHARVGALPGAGLTIRLPEVIGTDRALRMSLTGDFVGAAQAYEWGLVTEVVPHGALLRTARRVAASIASIPGANVRELRRMYAEIGDLSGGHAWRQEALRARQWMDQRFDRGRLAEQRQSIIGRGRSQI